MSERTEGEGPGGGVRVRDHRLHVLAGELLRVLTEAASVETFGMDQVEAAETTVELTRAVSMLHGLALRVLARADRLDVGSLNDSTSTVAWLRSRLPITAAAASRELALARALDAEKHAATAAGVAAGEVLVEQAPVILAAVAALPGRLFAEERSQAETHLVGAARVHDATALKQLGRHLLEVVAPDLAEA